LRSLQQSLSGKNLLAEIGAMSQHKVEVELPKFSVTFGVSLEGPFKKVSGKLFWIWVGIAGNSTDFTTPKLQTKYLWIIK